MLSREERILSELLVSRGLTSHERIASFAPSRGSLAETLIDSGEVERGAVRQVAAEARALDEALTPELPAGHQLGEFHLVREIGRGGMGIVYEAEQVALGRRVALKILPAGAALDERLSLRFLREARAVGRLRHPGIVPIHTSGREGGVLYYAMELIEGRSLAQALDEAPLDPRQAARVAAEVARALDYAHGQGLVHRDVKPENILLGPDGAARLVDFGLVHDLAAGSLTLSRHVLGTPAFSAPEQARGLPISARSDVYSLGAVLYSMLAGKPPYEGNTPPVVLARLLTEEPPSLARCGRPLPRALVAIAERAMAREPQDRYPSAGALAEALEGFLGGSAPALAPVAGRRIAWTGALVLGIVLAALGGAQFLRRDATAVAAAPPEPAAGAFQLIAAGPGRKAAPTLSPDGTRLAYVSDVDGDWDIYLLDLAAGGPPVNVTVDSIEEGSPAFSPDGKTLAFTSARREGDETVRSIRLLDLATREVRPLAELEADNLTWSADGRAVLFADQPYIRPGSSSASSKLWSVEVASGRASPLTAMYAAQPAGSGAAGRVVFVAYGGGRTDLWTIPAQGGTPVRLTDDAAVEWSPVWRPDGREVLFGSDREGAVGLWRVGVDPLTGHPSGAAVRVAAGLAAPFYLAAGSAGTPVVLASVGRAPRLHRFTFDGVAVDLRDVAALGERFLAVDGAQRSPDGQSLAFTSGEDEDIVVAASDGSDPRLLTRDAFEDRAPRWSPGGERIAFQSDRTGNREIWIVGAEGGEAVRATWTDGDAGLPVWSPDGRQIATTATGLGACLVPADGGGPVPLPPLDGPERFEPWSWSPDGQQIAGTAGGVVTFMPAEGRYQRLTDSGLRPVWLADSRRLVYVFGRSIRLLDSRTGAARTLVSVEPAGLSSVLSPSADGVTIDASLTGSAEELWRVDLRD